jgi:putative ABC transport system permease protein
MAIGASRTRVARQLLTASVLLALLGGLAGLLLAWASVRPLQQLASDAPVIGAIELDGRVLAFNLVASLVTGLLFGLAPALQLVRAPVPEALKGDRSTGGGLRKKRVRDTFIVVQVALSLVLLVGAGLLIRSFAELLRVDPGFDPKNLLTMEYRLPRNKYPEPAAQARFHLQVAARAREGPGVVSAAVVSGLPFSGNGGTSAIALPGQPPPSEREPEILTLAVSPAYFDTLGIPILRGRTFTESDGPDAPGVILVNKAMAERFWPGDDPVGKQVEFTKAKTTATVVGVVGDAKQFAMDEKLAPQIYTSYAQNPGIFATVVARTAVEPMSLAEAVRGAVWSVDSEQPVWKVRTVESLIDSDLATARNVMALMTVFGFVALVLAALGIYGVISYSVEQRTQEIGVRMAVGASAWDVFQLVVRGGVGLALVGIAVGVIAAAGLTRLMAGLLYGVGPTDPLTFVVVPFVLTAVAVLACYVPARRATRVDPMVVLREE